MNIADDLIWALTSRNLTDEAWLAHWPVDTDLVAWLAAKLSSDNHHFEQSLGQARARRLGHYFEQLWHYYWHHEPDTQVLKHSLQVIEHGNTVGEADFLLTHRGEVVHVELACKFYLRWQEQWLGPNAQDSWQHKAAQMRNKQLTLLATEAGLSTLNQQALPHPSRSMAICKGRLFNQLDWLHADKRARLINQPYHILQRQQWLAEVRGAPHQLNDILALSIDRPVCIAVIKENHETHRFFIVPNHWPEQP